MFVLVDLEWQEISSKRYNPTQLAALRVDADLNVTEEFFCRCRPHAARFYNALHIAYAGGSAEDFFNADSAYDVLEKFLNWISIDDELLWWSEEAPVVLDRLLSAIHRTKLPNRSRCIRSAFKRCVDDGKRKRGGLYSLAEIRDVAAQTPEHCSIGDVYVLHGLLRAVGFQPEWLERPAAPVEVTPAKPQHFPYWVDTQTGLAHTQGCPDLFGTTAGYGVGKLETAIRHEAKPCPVCCRLEWQKALKARNEDVVRRSDCGFFYLKGGKVFHTAECSILLRSAKPPFGITYYKSCIERGLRPCKICKPQAGELASKAERRRLQRQQNPAATKAVRLPLEIAAHKRQLTEAEKRAVKRHERATADRAKVNLNSLPEAQRKDVLVLTSSSYAFFAATGYGNFHHIDCPKLKGLTGIRGFMLYGDAVKAGYQPCRHCRPTAKMDIPITIPNNSRVRPNEKIDSVIAKAESYGYRCSYEKPVLTLETPVGRWIVEVHYHPIFVEHQHTNESAATNSELHWQPRLFLSLEDVVDYVHRHDQHIISASLHTR